MASLVGKGRDAIDLIFDSGTFKEGHIDDAVIGEGIGPGAVIGTAMINGTKATVIANDAKAMNPRFRVVKLGIIGMEEGYKMALAVYKTVELDKDKPKNQKRPLVLIVDTPGNGPGKQEEIFGMNKATGAYQLALAEARHVGHPIIAMVIGRAISGAFLCHGLQADHILALPKEFNTMIHVMPLTSISRITKMDIEKLESLAQSNPVFASGASFFHKLGGIEEIVNSIEDMKAVIDKHIKEVYALKGEGKDDLVGPWGRGQLGKERGGRETRMKIIETMKKEFAAIASEYK